MKNILFSLTFTLLAALGLPSCNGFLDMEPTTAKYAPNSILDVNDAQIAINGVYRIMTSSSYYGRDMLLYGDFKGGDFGLVTTGIAGDGLYFFTHSQSSSTYSGFWTTGYSIILQANNIIENIESGNVAVPTADDQTKLDNIKGQALAVRALVHFDLTRLYGYPYLKNNGTGWGAPVVTKVLPASTKVGRNTVAECYTQIIQDLKDAQFLLSVDKKVGYISRNSAKALLARVYLYKGDWDNAYTLAQDVINNGGYTPYTAANWVDSWSKQGGSESIFEIIISPSENDLGRNSPRGYLAPRNGSGRNDLGPMMVSDQFLPLLTTYPDDKRWSLFGLDEFGNGRTSSSPIELRGRRGWLMKYESDGKLPASAVNIKVIRLSEVLLIGAEAAIKKSTPDLASAAKWINIVRDRNPVLAANPLADTDTPATLQNEVMLQRRIELIGEGHRFFDVLRNPGGVITFTDGGYFNDIPNGGRGSSIDWNFGKIILPIFDNEMNANPAIRDQQNDAYK